MAPSRGGNSATNAEGSTEQVMPSPGEACKEHGGQPSCTWYLALKASATLWLAGLKEACMLHRALLFFIRSRPVLMKSGQCFLLNGFFFLGSILVMDCLLAPSLKWLLLFEPASQEVKGSLVGGPPLFLTYLNFILVTVWNVTWLYPLYIISFIINMSWHSEIAKQACQFLQHEPLWPVGLVVGAPESTAPHAASSSKAGAATPAKSKGGMDSLLQTIGEEVYRITMFAVFFAEVVLVSFVPYIGQPLYFVLLAWLYAFYCFDYKWSIMAWSLDKRLQFFEAHWAFFAGFGAPCTLATFFLPFFTSAAVWAVVFPLYVLVAAASDPEQAVADALDNDGALLASIQRCRIPLFRVATSHTLGLIRLFLPGGDARQRPRPVD